MLAMAWASDLVTKHMGGWGRWSRRARRSSFCISGDETSSAHCSSCATTLACGARYRVVAGSNKWHMHAVPKIRPGAHLHCKFVSLRYIPTGLRSTPSTEPQLGGMQGAAVD